MTAFDPTCALQSPSAEPQHPLQPAVCLDERLCHLFRASLKNGLIHPLYLPVLRYRHAQAAT